MGEVLDTEQESEAASDSRFFEPITEQDERSFHDWSQRFWWSNSDLILEPDLTGIVVRPDPELRPEETILTLAFDASEHQSGIYKWQLRKVESRDSPANSSNVRLNIWEIVTSPGGLDFRAYDMDLAGNIKPGEPVDPELASSIIEEIHSSISSESTKVDINKLRERRQIAQRELGRFSLKILDLGEKKYSEDLKKMQERFDQAGFIPAQFVEIPNTQPLPIIHIENRRLPLKFHSYFDVPRPPEVLFYSDESEIRSGSSELAEHLYLFPEDYEFEASNVEPLGSASEAVLSELRSSLTDYLDHKEITETEQDPKERVKQDVKQHLAKGRLLRNLSQLVYDKQHEVFPTGNFTVNGRLYRYDKSGFYVATADPESQKTWLTLTNFGLLHYPMAIDKNWIELAEDMVSHFEPRA